MKAEASGTQPPWDMPCARAWGWGLWPWQSCPAAAGGSRWLYSSPPLPCSVRVTLKSCRANVSIGWQLSGKSKSGRSLNEELGDEDSEKKRKGAFFSWSRTRSTGRSQKKKEHGDHANGSCCADVWPGGGPLGRRRGGGAGPRGRIWGAQSSAWCPRRGPLGAGQPAPPQARVPHGGGPRVWSSPGLLVGNWEAKKTTSVLLPVHPDSLSVSQLGFFLGVRRAT